MSNIFKFPYSVSRRAHARKPRASKNGTPEDRADLREMGGEEIDAPVKPKIVGGTDYSLDSRPPARSLSRTAKNGHLRQERLDVWRMAEAATRYWRLRLEFEEAVSWAQRKEIPEGGLHPVADPDLRRPMVEKYRAALAKQLLAPAWDAASVKWKQTKLASEREGYWHLDVKPERIERAIADDLEFLAAHPVRQSKRRGGQGFENGGEANA